MSFDSMLKQLQGWKAALPAPEPEPVVIPPDVHDPVMMEAFLSLDEQSIPDFDHAPTAQDEYGTKYCLYRTAFRHDKMLILRHLERDDVHYDDIIKVKLWCEQCVRSANDRLAND